MSIWTRVRSLLILRPLKISRRRADGDAYRQPDRRRYDAYEKRHARTIGDAGGDVAAERIGAEGKRGVLPRPQKGPRHHAKRIAWKAQQRLHKRFTAMAARGKINNVIVTALARELLGFMWAIAVHTEAQTQPATAA